MTLLPADEREILFCASSLSWSVERIARDFGLPCACTTPFSGSSGTSL
jgi:hypothetical protein